MPRPVIRGRIHGPERQCPGRDAMWHEDGTETRDYPYGDVFAHVIGYSDPDYGNTGLESVENFELLTSNAFFVEKIQNEFKR